MRSCRTEKEIHCRQTFECGWGKFYFTIVLWVKQIHSTGGQLICMSFSVILVECSICIR